MKKILTDDRIDFELCLNDLEKIIEIFSDRALKAKTYESQTSERKIKDYFQSRYDEWKKLRREIEEEERNEAKLCMAH